MSVQEIQITQNHSITPYPEDTPSTGSVVERNIFQALQEANRSLFTNSHRSRLVPTPVLLSFEATSLRASFYTDDGRARDMRGEPLIIPAPHTVIGQENNPFDMEDDDVSDLRANSPPPAEDSDRSPQTTPTNTSPRAVSPLPTTSTSTITVTSSSTVSSPATTSNNTNNITHPSPSSSSTSPEYSDSEEWTEDEPINQVPLNQAPNRCLIRCGNPRCKHLNRNQDCPHVTRCVNPNCQHRCLVECCINDIVHTETRAIPGPSINSVLAEDDVDIEYSNPK